MNKNRVARCADHPRSERFRDGECCACFRDAVGIRTRGNKYKKQPVAKKITKAEYLEKRKPGDAVPYALPPMSVTLLPSRGAPFQEVGIEPHSLAAQLAVTDGVIGLGSGEYIHKLTLHTKCSAKGRVAHAAPSCTSTDLVSLGRIQIRMCKCVEGYLDGLEALRPKELVKIHERFSGNAYRLVGNRTLNRFQGEDAARRALGEYGYVAVNFMYKKSMSAFGEFYGMWHESMSSSDYDVRWGGYEYFRERRIPITLVKARRLGLIVKASHQKRLEKAWDEGATFYEKCQSKKDEDSTLVELERSEGGMIYVFTNNDNGLVKVGWTSEKGTGMKPVRVGKLEKAAFHAAPTVHAVMPGTVKQEKRIHRLLDSCSTYAGSGVEWFKREGPVETLLANVSRFDDAGLVIEFLERLSSATISKPNSTEGLNLCSVAA